jgi:hypothetical protein
MNINLPQSIPISTAGHVMSANTTGRFTKEERMSLYRLRGCPINKRIRTKMLKETFVKICMKKQKKANMLDTDKTYTATSVNGAHFAYNNASICGQCVIAEQIRNEEEFEPPVGITFIELKDYIKKPELKIENKCHVCGRFLKKERWVNVKESKKQAICESCEELNG